jgi:hypothetical protein
LKAGGGVLASEVNVAFLYALYAGESRVLPGVVAIKEIRKTRK